MLFIQCLSVFQFSLNKQHTYPGAFGNAYLYMWHGYKNNVHSFMFYVFQVRVFFSPRQGTRVQQGNTIRLDTMLGTRGTKI